MTFVVTFHDGGGSMVEASNQEYAYPTAGGFTTREDAETFGEAVFNRLSEMESYLVEDFWYVVREVKSVNDVSVEEYLAKVIKEYEEG